MLSGVAGVALCAAFAITATPPSSGELTHASVQPRVIIAGHSVEGRAIRASARGPSGGLRVLVVGSIHGDEAAGHEVVRRLRSVSPPKGIQVWTVRSVNPDGAALGTRANARGVDLNRNFPYRWRRQGSPFSANYSGVRPMSEPESRTVRRLVRRVRPQVTIWYHQALGLVDTGSGADPGLVRAYARRSGLPARRVGFLPGVATRWQNKKFPGTSAFVVELPAGPLSRPAVDRHARAVFGVARLAAATAAGHAAAHPRQTSDRVTRPVIERRHIPFGPRRKQEMRRYARRHYGIDDYHLRSPRVVVLHLSVTENVRSVIETFSRDEPDSELGELPGVCAHYVIDAGGRILELVSRRLMCRHTVGLNHVAFGIEHVGMRESQVMHRKRQLQASLALVRWLQERYGIRTRDVIGHNESLKSPYHRERVARLRNQTHADFPHAVAQRYRQLLGG